MAEEKKTQQKVIDWAKRNGIPSIRLVFKPGVPVGWPDVLFLLPGGVAAFIEFKSTGKTPTAKQWERMNTLEDQGFYVTWTDDADDGIAWLGAISRRQTQYT